MRATMKAKLETFAADAFDANAFATPPKGEAGFGPRGHREHIAGALAAIVPILEQTQRDALATRIEQGPPAPPGAPRRQAR